ncbi:N-acetylmuramoyl-L-alanine amidase [Flavobacterium sp. 245]|uniref:N-acetylmuramoyl-L-alanine amidase n=1 Tax=Flavobacterium sp. 245 TaxID=2512115 RepID=UPI00105D947A|nr:N-acetylmuramoyl-L-alanine amidase [Flavobacterium sp. 245]TDP03858.1 N-acetylmuramoyl-L-alanine amidase [Flavobacterium sp. 245]
MIDFLVKSTISLSILLVVYHLFLQKEKMFRFNRYFLLVSLFFSITVSFISFEIQQDIPIAYNNVIKFQNITANTLPIQEEVTSINIEEQTSYWLSLLWITYIAITLILSYRFIQNIYRITSKAKISKIIFYQNIRMVLLSEETLPYSFWNSIYINQNDFENGLIEQELFTHEIAHVKQKHTLDVIFIEILKTLFWFNPIFIFYKKAMQLNHEFLADENVIMAHNDVCLYQKLLFNKLSTSQPIYLASNFNFLSTKKRLIMMTKITSKTRILVMKSLAVSGILILFLLFAFKPLPLGSKKTIVIDAGHGGEDIGAQIGVEQEKKIVENIAKKISVLNGKDEIEIILLRNDDSFIELSERVSKINKINPNLVISLHVNSSPDLNKNGVNAYVSKQNGFYEKSMEDAKSLVDKISNEKLARGEVKEANYYVLKNSKCPALLVEIGYLSNDNDRDYLASENGQNEIANKIVEFIKL